MPITIPLSFGVVVANVSKICKRSLNINLKKIFEKEGKPH